MTRFHETRIFAAAVATLLVAASWAAPGALAEDSGSEFNLTNSLTNRYGSLSLGQANSGDSSYWEDHFRLYGYLTTAYAELDPAPIGRTGDQRVLGLEEDGSWEYRNAALQLRYDVNPKNTFIVQLSHRDYGDSPIGDIEDEVELDWLFYEYRFNDSYSLKLGRVPVPVGIFNEYRDVGTLLPFFRPSFNFYREGSFVSETVDGAIFVGRVFQDSNWSLDFDIFYGEFDLVEQAGLTADNVFEAEATDDIGFQLWLNSPVDGLRFGFGGQRYDVEGSGFHTAKDEWETWYASVDGVFDRWTARAEYKYLSLPSDNTVIVGGELELFTWYFQLGFNITDALSIWVQPEFADVEQDGINLRRIDFVQRDDLGFSLVYAIRPNIVLKAEYHEETFESIVGFGVEIENGIPTLVFSFDEFESEYIIGSVSLSF
ncbi:MAG: hypothetical protein AAGD01_09190 [Acidobacteriota bacterium]